MSGFVDVSGMSSEDVRRMGHADDCDDVDHQPRRGIKRNPYGYNNSNRPERVANAQYSVSDVWGAACAAHRVNGGYFKDSIYEWDEANQHRKIVHRKNRDVMMEFLTAPDRITAADHEQGQQVRNFLQNDLTFRAVKGQLTEFDSAVNKCLAVQDQFDQLKHRYELAVIACLPSSAAKAQQRQETTARIQFARGGMVGQVGDKVLLGVEVLSSTYSQQFGVYFVKALTDQDQPVVFANKERFDAGTHLTIQGKVRAHTDNLTRLNYVKVL